MVPEIFDLMKETVASARSMEAGEKLALIVLGGAVLRSLHTVVTYDGLVYQLWLDHVLATGSIPYPDHPPLFFAVSGFLETAFLRFRSLGATIYWWTLLIPLAGIFRLGRNRSPVYSALAAYLLLYVGVVGYLGAPYEIGSLGSFLAGLAAIPLAHRVGVLWSNRAGIYAAAFMAVFWWPLIYSGVLLIDMFAATVIAAAYYAYYLFLERPSPSRRLTVVTTLLLAAALYTKYYALLILPLIAAWGMYRSGSLPELARNAVPGIAATIAFLPWVVYAGVPLDHYAASHYLFLRPPSPIAYGRFLAWVYGPVLLLAVVPLLRRSGDELGRAIYFAAPVPVALSFYAVNAFLLGRSHALINLSNYMLFTVPLTAGLAGVGWERLSGSLPRPGVMTLLLLAILLAPVLVAPGISLEYDERYTAPNHNANTLSPAEIAAAGVSDPPSIHWVYSFEKRPAILGEVRSKTAHFRWLNATAFRVVALRPVTYRLDVRPTEDASPLRLTRDGEVIAEIDSSTDNITVDIPQGSHRFRLRGSDAVFPYVLRQRRVDPGEAPDPAAAVDRATRGWDRIRIHYDRTGGPEHDIRRLAARIDTVSLESGGYRTGVYDIGRGSREPPLGEGWFVPTEERTGDRVRHSRWTGDANRDGVAEAILFLRIPEGTDAITFRALGVAPGINFTVSVNGRAMGSGVLSREWQEYRFPIGETGRETTFK